MHLISTHLAKLCYWQGIAAFEMPDFHVITNRYHRVSQTDDHLNVSKIDVAQGTHNENIWNI